MTYRASASAIGNNTAPGVTVPGTVVAGDQLILIMAWGNTGSPVVTSPPGWTAHDSDFVNGALTVRGLVKTAVAGDIGSAAVGATGGVVVKWCAAVFAYSALAGIIDWLTSTDPAASNTHDSSAQPSTAAADAVLDMWIERSTTNTGWTPPVGMTSRVNQLGTGGGAISMLAGEFTGATSYPAETATSDVSTKATKISIQLGAVSGVTAPGVPTAPVATSGDGQATVAFTPGANNGDPNVVYTAVSTPGSKTGTSNGSPVVITGLTNGVAYTFKVHASNSAGSSADSAATAPVTPIAGTPTFRTKHISIIAGGNTVTPPGTVENGMAISGAPSYQSNWNNYAVPAGLKMLRSYDTGLPVNWAASTAVRPTGPTAWVHSVKPNIAQTIAGQLDNAIKTFAASVPANQYLTAQHEPENKTKAIKPSDFAAFMQRFHTLVKSVNPSLKVGMVFMTFTSNDRPSDAGAGGTPHIAGHNEWLEAAATAGYIPDWVGWDGYPAGASGAASEFEPCRLIAQGLYPGIEQNCMELGFVASGIRSQQVVDAYNYFVVNGFKKMVYFNAVGTSGKDFTLNFNELQILGGLGGSF